MTVEKDLRSLLQFGLLVRSIGSTHVQMPQLPDASPSFRSARSPFGMLRGLQMGGGTIAAAAAAAAASPAAVVATAVTWEPL